MRRWLFLSKSVSSIWRIPTFFRMSASVPPSADVCRVLEGDSNFILRECQANKDNWREFARSMAVTNR